MFPGRLRHNKRFQEGRYYFRGSKCCHRRFWQFFNELQESLKAADPDMVPEGLSSGNFIKLDHDFIVTTSCITEDDILEQFQTH